MLCHPLVVAEEQPVRDLPCGGLVCEFDRLGAEPLDAHHGDEAVRQDPADGGVRSEVLGLLMPWDPGDPIGTTPLGGRASAGGRRDRPAGARDSLDRDGLQLADGARVESLWIDGDFLALDVRRERSLVRAFERAGWRCVRDDRLVRQASGYLE